MSEDTMMDNHKNVQVVESVDEADYYPAADKQYPNARKYMTYESISTGVGGK
jgi:hypothetical protein